MNLDYAIGSKKMLDGMLPLSADIELSDEKNCRRYFRIIEFWNEQIRKGMGWN